MERLRRPVRVVPRRRWDHREEPRLGFFSPLPPAPTGVATYAQTVLEGLRRLGFLARHRMDVNWPIEPRHEGLVPWYRLGIYQLGNNVEFHRDIYRFACQAPGLITLHDLALDDFVRGLKVAGDPLGFVAEREAAALRARLASPGILENEPLREPWCGHVVRRARGIVVHSEFCRRYLLELGCLTPVFVVPHPAVERENDLRQAERRRGVLRAPIEARGGEFVVGILGDLNGAKLVDLVLAAIRELPETVHVALVGRRITGYDVDGVLEESGLGARATLHANVSDDDFRAWLFASDVVVDLRHPHRGEVSGTLARAMQAGRPAVVSATGTYLDLPGEVVLRVSAGRPDPGEIVSTLRGVMEHPDVGARVGAAARARLETLARSDATARGYAEAIDVTLELVRDPARRALARWAGALSDLGISGEGLDRGYGLGYVHALETFTRSS